MDMKKEVVLGLMFLLCLGLVSAQECDTVYTGYRNVAGVGCIEISLVGCDDPGLMTFEECETLGEASVVSAPVDAPVDEVESCEKLWKGYRRVAGVGCLEISLRSCEDPSLMTLEECEAMDESEVPAAPQDEEQGCEETWVGYRFVPEVGCLEISLRSCDDPGLMTLKDCELFGETGLIKAPGTEGCEVEWTGYVYADGCKELTVMDCEDSFEFHSLEECEKAHSFFARIKYWFIWLFKTIGGWFKSLFSLV